MYLSSSFSYAKLIKTLEDIKYPNDTILVKFKPNINKKTIQDILKKYNLTIKDDIKEIGYHILNVPPEYQTDIDNLVSVLENNECVEAAEVDSLIEITNSPL